MIAQVVLKAGEGVRLAGGLKRLSASRPASAASSSLRTLLALAMAVAAITLQAADVASQISEKVDAALKQSGVPAVSIAVVEDNKITYVRAFGYADVAGQRRANADTRFAIGSVSKQFTAFALLTLQEEGKLSLDDKVSKYFPELTRSSEVSIRQLLSHTAGYEDYAPQDYLIPAWTHPTTPGAILEHWAHKPLNFDPGTQYQYSNTNFVLAGEIFEKVSGQPLLAFLKTKVFDPLGMTSAGDCEATSSDDATAYTRYALGPARPVGREAPGWYFAAGELCMTASDLAKWDVALLERRFLSLPSYTEWTKEVRLANGNGTHYALGLQLGELNGIPTWSHGGEVSGFLALNTVLPSKNGAVVVLSNQDGINVIGPLSQQIEALIFLPHGAAPDESSTKKARQILEALTLGTIDQSLLTENARSYFKPLALSDLKNSLDRLGPLKAVVPVREGQRGGMTHQSFQAEFEKKTLVLNIYVAPDGKYEQYLVEDQL
jgi:D-alanyl-D-alanine carboxypeptidase